MLEGRRIGRRPLDIDRAAVLRDRAAGKSLSTVAKAHGISRSMNLANTPNPVADGPRSRTCQAQLATIIWS